MELKCPIPDNKEYDVVIVGGGISGLYCAMKLMEKPESAIKRIIILEKSDRWGGRLDTDIINIDNRLEFFQVKEEEGAMRFTYHSDPDRKPKSNMPLLSRLIKDLEMEDEICRFYMEPQRDPPSSQGKPLPNSNTRYFYGNHFTDWYATQNPTMWKSMFNLVAGHEEFKSSGEIVKDIYRRLLDHNEAQLQFNFPNKAKVILAQHDTKLLEEYEDTEYWAFFRNKFSWTVGLQEIPLNEFSMQALLTAMDYSYGCIMMMMQTQGYLFITLSDGNVGAILQDLITFNLITSNLHQFENGWSSLVKKVIQHLQKSSKIDEVNVELKDNCAAVMIREDEKGFTLTLETQSDTKTMDISAKYVVMALPPKAVEAIFNSSKDWDIKSVEKVMEICQSVDGIHLTKINLYYSNDWWNQDENTLMYGPNFTSLPCGSVYPFYGRKCKSAGCKGCDKCEDDPCPAALTIYCDLNNAQFWSSLQRLGYKFQSPLQSQNKNLTPASESVVHEAKKQLKKLFNIQHIPRPILTSYRSWDPKQDHDKYGYAIHMWGLGVDDSKVMNKVSQPIEGKNLYFCNEAWSGYQGWVEGALMSTENAVRKLLKDSDKDEGEI